MPANLIMQLILEVKPLFQAMIKCWQQLQPQIILGWCDEFCAGLSVDMTLFVKNKHRCHDFKHRKEPIV
jgi:hypothetical protein